jgi:hypothetical protein
VGSIPLHTRPTGGGSLQSCGAIRRLVELGPEGEREMTDDPNEAYEVVPMEPGPHGPPAGWWTVKRNGLPVRHFPGKEKAERYATDPEYRASLVTARAWEKAKGK